MSRDILKILFEHVKITVFFIENSESCKTPLQHRNFKNVKKEKNYCVSAYRNYSKKVRLNKEFPGIFPISEICMQ